MNIILGEYINRDSVLHHLDPRTKLIGSFSLILSFLFANNLSIYLIYSVLALILIFLSKIPLTAFLKSLKYLSYILIFSALFEKYSDSLESLGLVLPKSIDFLNRLNKNLKNPLKFENEIKEEDILKVIEERLINKG